MSCLLLCKKVCIRVIQVLGRYQNSDNCVGQILGLGEKTFHAKNQVRKMTGRPRAGRPKNRQNRFFRFNFQYFKKYIKITYTAKFKC